METQPQRQKSKRVTLADIAKVSGVSQAIVSRVLSGSAGSTRFSPETADRVRVASKSLGYIPSARSIPTEKLRTMTLGFAIPGTGDAYMKMVAAAIHAAARLGYELIVTAGSNAESDDYALRIARVLDRKVDGLVLVPSGPFQQSRTYRDLLTSGLPTVLLEHDIRNSGFDFVGIDDVAGYREVVARLKAAGHQRIGFMYELESFTLSGHQRLVDFERIIDEADLPVLPSCYFQSIEPGSVEQLRHIYGKKRTVTATVIRGRARLLWAMEQFKELGLRVPSDLSVVSISSYDYANDRMPFDAVLNPMAELGARATELLVERIQHPDLPPRVEVRSGTFQAGNTITTPRQI